MKLGILVNSRKHLSELADITRAALAKGHEVIIFVMGEGSGMLNDEDIGALGSLEGVKVSFCDLNASKSGIEKGTLDASLNSGSQFDNALMARDADRVISL